MKVNKQKSDEFYDVDGLTLFMALRDFYTDRVRNYLFRNEFIFEAEKIPMKNIKDIERLTNKSIEELLNR